MKLIRTTLLAAFLILLSVSSVEAHQSGCHRWHSCPSDSGSYVCGDSGYACQYPTYPQSSSYVAPKTYIPPTTNTTPQTSTTPTNGNTSAKVQGAQTQNNSEDNTGWLWVVVILGGLVWWGVSALHKKDKNSPNGY